MSSWLTDWIMLFWRGGPNMLAIPTALLAWAAAAWSYWRVPSIRRLALMVLASGVPVCVGLFATLIEAHLAADPHSFDLLYLETPNDAFLFGVDAVEVTLIPAGFGALGTLVAVLGSAGALMAREPASTRRSAPCSPVASAQGTTDRPSSSSSQR